MGFAQKKHEPVTKASLLEEATTTLRVPMSLRNSLKKIAAIEKVHMRELTVEVLQKYVRAYEVSIDRSLADFSRERRR